MEGSAAFTTAGGSVEAGRGSRWLRAGAAVGPPLAFPIRIGCLPLRHPASRAVLRRFFLVSVAQAQLSDLSFYVRAREQIAAGGGVGGAADDELAGASLVGIAAPPPPPRGGGRGGKGRRRGRGRR